MSTVASANGGRRLAIVGITGRMGSEIRSLASSFQLQVTSGVAAMAASHDDDVKIVERIDQLDARNVDVVIDFSLPEATDAVLKWCTQNKIPLVSGVTGISEAQKKGFAEAGKTIAAFWAPNMSLGVAVMARMLAPLADLNGFEFQIEELHHKHKKDKPSGTALFLQQRLIDAVGKSSSGEIPDPLAIRGGGIFGVHRVWAMGEEETITIEHTAMNRRVFARGALKAADWILSRGPGLYRMDDLLMPS